MAWIELHQTRQRHPKTLRLAAAMDVSRREACGLLDDLWTWALDIATPDGLLPGLTCDDVAIALDFPRKRGEWLMDALMHSGYVDQLESGAYMLHDWPDYAGRLNDKRKDTKARVERYRERKKAESVTQCNALQSVTKSKSNASTVPKPYPTVPYQENSSSGSTRDAPDWNPFGAATETPPDTVESYLSANLPPLTRGNIEELTAIEEAGMQPDAIRYAVDQAAAQGKRTWAYVKGILRRWEQAGIFTAGAARAAEEQRDTAKTRTIPGRTTQPALSKAEQFLEMARRYEEAGE